MPIPERTRPKTIQINNSNKFGTLQYITASRVAAIKNAIGLSMYITVDAGSGIMVLISKKMPEKYIHTVNIIEIACDRSSI